MIIWNSIIASNFQCKISDKTGSNLFEIKRNCTKMITKAAKFISQQFDQQPTRIQAAENYKARESHVN